MNKTYVYRKHLRFMPKVMIGISIIGVGIAVLGFFIDTFLVGFGVFFALYGVLLGTFVKRLSSLTLTVTDEYIHYKNNKHNMKFTYDEIARLEPKVISYTGGWLNIIPKQGKPLKITVVLADVADLVLTLKNKFDELGQSDKYYEHEIFKFYKTAGYSDDSWRRSYYFIPRMFGIIIVHMFAVSFIGGYLDMPQLPFMGFIAIFGMLAYYLYIELGVYAKEIKKQTTAIDWNLPKTDEVLEKKRLNRVILVYLGLIAVTVVLGVL